LHFVLVIYVVKKVKRVLGMYQ